MAEMGCLEFQDRNWARGVHDRHMPGEQQHGVGVGGHHCNCKGFVRWCDGTDVDCISGLSHARGMPSTSRQRESQQSVVPTTGRNK